MTSAAGDPLAQAAAFALISSVWQGTVIAAGASLGLLLLARASAHARYVFTSCCMAAMVAVPAATGVRTYHAYSRATSEPARPAPVVESFATPATTHVTSSDPETPPIISLVRSVVDSRPVVIPAWTRNLVLALWLSGVALHVIRIILGLRGTYLLARTATIAPPWLEQLTHAAAQLIRVSATAVRVSAQVTMPLVIGIARPVVLIPASFIANVQPDVLRALIAHELAHVRRHDFLLNLVQRIAEALLFFHPGMWWLSRRIRDEREHCCDEIAAEVLQDRRAVARALVVAEQMRTTPSPAMALAATDGWLTRRVHRLLAPPPAVRDSRAAVVAAIPLVCALLAIPATARREALAMADPEWQQVWSGDLADATWLRVYNLTGPITVERRAAERAVVLAHRSGAQVQMVATSTTDGLAICVIRPQLGDCNADGLIWRGSPEELTQSVTALRVIVPVTGAVEAAAHSGDVVIRGGVGPAVARSGAGAIDVVVDGGDIEAASSNGRIRVAGGGDVDVRSSNGDVELTGVSGDVRVQTTRGDVIASLALGLPDRTFDISTGTGSVSLSLPPNVRATLSASAHEGTVQLDTPSESSGNRRERRVLIGGGGRRASITTGGGDITVTTR